MASFEAHNLDTELAQVKIAARCLAPTIGLDSAGHAGPAALLAGLLAVLGAERSGTLLKPLGVSDVEGILAALPQVSADAAKLPALKPNKSLATLMKGELAGFFNGRKSAEAAAQTLLKHADGDPQVRRLLGLEPKHSGEHASREGLASTRELLRELGRLYQPRYRLARQYYGFDDRGNSDFLEGKHDEAFARAIDAVYENERDAYRTIFCDPLYLDSPLGEHWRELGEDEGHVLNVVTLAEVGHVGPGPLTVRSLSWISDPKYAHRTMARTREIVDRLFKQKLVQVCPDGTPVRLHDQVFAGDDLMQTFLEYLRDADPIGVDEQNDLLKRLPSR